MHASPARKAGDAALALRHFEAALKRFPDAADLHNELGFAYPDHHLADSV